VSELPVELSSRFVRDEPIDTGPDPIEAEAAGSILDVIRQRRQGRTADHAFHVLVPGYRGLLALRCVPIPSDEMTELRGRIAAAERAQDSAVDLAVASDFLIRACDSVVARRTRAAAWEPLDPNGDPVGIDSRLADLLGLEATSARQALLGLFSLVPSPDMAIQTAVSAYLDWARGVDADADEELLGES